MNLEISIAATYFLLFRLILIISQKYSKFTFRDNLHIASKVTSCINAGLAVGSSCIYLLDNTQTKQIANYLTILRGYTVFDSINITYYHKHFDWAPTIIHHLSLFCLTRINMNIKRYPYYAARGLIAEITNFPLYFGWFLIKKKKIKTKLFKINAFLLVLLFFLLRASNFTHLTWYVLKDANPTQLEKLTMFILSCLNNYWFFKLSKKAFKLKNTNTIILSNEEENNF
jgi:hypothetical protein